MRTITVSKRAKGINTLLNQARRQNLIIRSPDGREFVLAEVDDFNREIELMRQNKELMAFLDLRAEQTKTVPFDKVKAQLGLV
jgi:hypothetical protein